MKHVNLVLWAYAGLAASAIAAIDGEVCLCGKEGPGQKASAPAGFDAESGRNTRFYPPHLNADYKHVKLELTIPDMNVPKLTATETLTLSPIAGPLSGITLDAKAMAVSSVSATGYTTEFEYDGKKLSVKFEPAVPADASIDLVVQYELDDPPLGMVWTPESPTWPGRPAQIHTQGEPETNSYWFPCHDFPNDKLTSEVIVTLPAGYVVSSNGRLVDRSRGVVAADVEGGKSLAAYESWHWLQDKPHAPYLVSLVVGKFDIVDVGTRQLSMPVYVPPGRGEDVAASYGHTAAMIEYFGRVLEEPYPWDRYAQLVVWNFGAGGMENTSATTMYDTAILSPDALIDGDLDGLISHELGHQWFGDLITCNSWEHIWLNEGFATYMTGLWMAHRDGKGAYEQHVRGNFDGIIAGDKPESPARVGMVSNVYEHPWEAFRRPANPYGKGASILHMLRRKLGDDIFFKGIAKYIDDHKFATVETTDFRQTMEAVSGASLEQFFQQWCYRPGVPSANVNCEWKDGVLTVTLEQTQNIDGDNPAFEFDLPVVVQLPGEHAPKNASLNVRGKQAKAEIPCPEKPLFVAVDPEQNVLAGFTIEQPADQWLAQLAQGPTLWSRVQAARGLRSGHAVKEAEHLRRLALDSKQPAWLRCEAVRALSARDDVNDLRSLSTAATDHWEVRLAIVESMPALAIDKDGKERTGYEGAQRLLADRATRDTSSRVRAAAIRGLGQIKSESHRTLVLNALTQNSQHDALRQAALEALASYDQKDMLPKAIELTKPGVDSRTRPAAVSTVAKLAHHDPDAAFGTLSELLNDRELRTQRAAGEALVTMKDQRAVPAFEALAKKTRSEEVSWQVGQWLKLLRTDKK
ncbi:MAG: M1 family metallopeptidase [Planctomycetes bacterium]|nr:M1 family metallopeptidase [Planctomycetota bacterium]